MGPFAPGSTAPDLLNEVLPFRVALFAITVLAPLHHAIIVHLAGGATISVEGVAGL